MTQHNKHLADRALLLCAVVFILASAIHTWLLPGPGARFVQLVSAAGLIGGLADWYGVVSVYGRPLSVPWRTELIIGKRGELTRAICDFVADDILTPTNIRQRLQGFNLAQRLLGLLQNPHANTPASWLAEFLAQALWDIYRTADLAEVGRIVNNFALGLVHRISPADDILRAARWTLDNGYLERIMMSLAPDCAAFTQNPGLRQLLAEFSEAIARHYAGDNLLRQLFLQRLRGKIATAIDTYLQTSFADMAVDPRHPITQAIRQRLEGELAALAADPRQQEQLNLRLQGWLRDNNLGAMITAELARLQASEYISVDTLRRNAQIILNQIISRVQGDAGLQAQLDHWLVEGVAQLAQTNRAAIRGLVQKNLDSYSDTQLIQLLRSSTEGDLQIIRLNGMVCGIIIGALIAVVRLIWIGGGPL